MNEDDAPLASLKKSSGKNSSSKPSRSYYAVRVGYAACPACSASKEEGSEGHQEEGDSKPHICGGSHVSVIRSAIFLRWEDVKDFVEFTTSKLSGERVSTVVAAAAAAAGGKGSSATDGVAGEYNKNEGVIQLPFHHNVEYKQFEELERAERYLKKVIPEFNQAGSNNFGSSSSRSSSKKSKYGKSKAAKAGKTKIKSLSRKAPLPDYPPPKNFNPPTKKWEATYAAAIQYKATYGNLDVPVDEEGPHAELSKWIKYQRTSYRYYLEDPMGGRHSMTDEKVNRLKEVGFDWIVLDKKKWLAEDPVANIGSNGKRKRGRPRKTAAMRLAEMEAAAASAGGGGGGRSSSKNRPIRPKWLAMLQKLKEYKETHGTIEIVAEENMSDELATLSQWCKNQRNMHIRWRQGHDVGMTQEKSDLLKEVGMEFPPAWEDMYVKIVQYKAQNNGSIDIAADYDPILAAWMARQNEVLGRHLQGKSTRLSDDQAMRLLALGFQGGRSAMANGGGGVSVTGKSVASRDFDARWDEMLLRLRDYKAEHGDCNVPTTNGTELAHWVAAQRRMYNKLIAGKPGKRAVLDAVKMQRLTELGFHFRPRGSYAAWEDQMKGLWKFREENGHCRIPVNHPELGSFVKLARRDYKNWTQGKPSSMTPEREAALKDVGFIFEGGKTPQRAQTPIKSWNERLDELLSLFGSLQDPGLKRKILRIKSNGPEVTSLELSRGDDLNERASMRLGCILGQDTHVKELTILCSLDVIGLCAGLQSNQCIQSLTLIGINLHHNAKLSALAPFVRNNPSLKCMTLHSGNIGSAGINILSAALLDRSEDTLEYLSLSNNHFGDINLDQLVLALNRNRNLSFLSLCGTGIGPRGCTSLAKLLSNRESNLRDLELDFNSIDNKSTIVLADSLRKNTKLEELELGGNNAITSEGWTAMLKLVCNSSKIDAIMQSNHTLCSIGYLSADLETRIYHS
ncbi:hypothetical protein ACHAXR_006396, partial [Thalassiosira sp. AJA248-18]